MRTPGYEERRRTKTMATKILIPTPLRGYTGNQEEVEATGSTVGELLANLASEHTELRKHLYGEDGSLRNFVNIYVNGEDVQFLDGLETAISESDEVSIVPAVAGGLN